MDDQKKADQELKAELLKYGVNAVVTETTRSVWRKQLEKLKEGPTEQDNREETHQENAPSSVVQTVPRPGSSPWYYGVATSTATPEESKSALSPVYENQRDVVRATKKCVGARFKKFDSREEAEQYSKLVLPQFLGPPFSIEKLLSPLPGVKIPDKNRLKETIDNGDVEKFHELVWSNPKYLLASGETPEILHVGTHRNAMHLAADGGHLDICKELIGVLESDGFWELVYPRDDLSVREKNKEHIIDMYLNMQDGTERLNTFDTPLHLASRKGHVDIVTYLMSFPAIDTSIKNGSGKTAADVACTRLSNAMDSSLRTRIQEIINDIYYVPVLRAIDNSCPPELGHPCTMDDYCPPVVSTSSDKVITSPLIGQAFAGPMSSKKAQDLLKEWRSPSSKEQRRKLSLIKRSDPDKGMERVGRMLAHNDGISWTEYWDFLGFYCDLSKPEGLQKLEIYLANLHSEPTMKNSTREMEKPMDTSFDFGQVEEYTNKMENVGNNASVDEENEDPLYSTAVPSFSLANKNSDDIVTDLTDKFESLEIDLHVPDGFKTPDKCSGTGSGVFITGFAPTKLDRDVFLALCNVTVDPVAYPHVHQWKKLINTFSEEQQKMWHTPKSNSKYPIVRDTHGLSPLVMSSPTPSSSPSSSSTRRHLTYTSLTPQQRRLGGGGGGTIFLSPRYSNSLNSPGSQV